MIWTVTFFHLSDIHIPDKQGDLWETIDSCVKLEKLIELAEKLELHPSFTMITGDISQTGTRQSYNLAKQYINQIQELGGVVLPTMGTMDDRRHFSNILLGKPSTLEDPICYYSQTIEGLHVIVMDSHTPGSHTGSFSDEQLDWLKTELKTHQEKPAIIAFHEPIFFFGRFGMFNKADATRFRDIVSKGHVLAVLNGHLHFPFYTMVDGIYYIQAGSPLWENVIHDRGGLSSYDSSSFNLLRYNEERLLVRPISFSEGTQLIERTT
ncbi:MAG: metallophosphoesterase [Candidatus Bathyarchaeota archaeon]|nr:metallophosphoesterase [Candidatus Bathyarchaeota archaeon]